MTGQADVFGIGVQDAAFTVYDDVTGRSCLDKRAILLLVLPDYLFSLLLLGDVERGKGDAFCRIHRIDRGRAQQDITDRTFFSLPPGLYRAGTVLPDLVIFLAPHVLEVFIGGVQDPGTFPDKIIGGIPGHLAEPVVHLRDHPVDDHANSGRCCPENTRERCLLISCSILCLPAVGDIDDNTLVMGYFSRRIALNGCPVINPAYPAVFCEDPVFLRELVDSSFSIVMNFPGNPFEIAGVNKGRIGYGASEEFFRGVSEPGDILRDIGDRPAFFRLPAEEHDRAVLDNDVCLPQGFFVLLARRDIDQYAPEAGDFPRAVNERGIDKGREYAPVSPDGGIFKILVRLAADKPFKGSTGTFVIFGIEKREGVDTAGKVILREAHRCKSTLVGIGDPEIRIHLENHLGEEFGEVAEPALALAGPLLAPGKFFILAFQFLF